MSRRTWILWAVALCAQPAVARPPPPAPPSAFLDLELCAVEVGGFCTVREWVASLGDPKASWTECQGHSGWTLHATVRGSGGAPVRLAVEVNGDCKWVVGMPPPKLSRPVAAIHGLRVDGRKTEKMGIVDRLLEKAARPPPDPRPAFHAPPRRKGDPAEPPAEVLDLELCGRFLDGQSCTVREFVAALHSRTKAWVPAAELDDPETPPDEVGYWQLRVQEDPTDDAYRFSFRKACTMAGPVSAFWVVQDDHHVNPFPSEAVQAMEQAARAAGRRWPRPDGR